MGEAKERARDEFYAQSESKLVAETNRYAPWVFPAVCRALVQQLRHPTIPVPWRRRIGFVMRFLVGSVLASPSGLAQMRRNVLAKRAARAARAR